MAHHANISVTESQFRCPICLDVLQDPVSIPCGHTYCMACINGYWDQAEPPDHFTCPQCREAFSPRPVLRRNTVLAEVVAKLKPRDGFGSEICPSEHYHGVAGQVPCDFCPPESKLAASKSCLVCLASFCESHVLPHREVETLRRHKLVEAVECPAERLCGQHRLGLQPRTGGVEPEEGVVDWTGNCLLCEADQEEVNPGEAQRARKQVQLQESQRKVQGKIRSCQRDLEELQQSLESLKVSVSAILEDSDALFADMAIRLEKTKAEVRMRVEARERVLVSRAEQDAETLEKDLEDLRRRDQEIGQLLLTEDNGHFLQAAPLLCLPIPATTRPLVASNTPAEAFSGARKVLGRLRSRLEDVCREELDSISRADPVNMAEENMKPQHSPARLRQDETHVFPSPFSLPPLPLQPADQRMRDVFLRFSCHLSLDEDTAHPTLVLFNGGQGAHCGEELQSYPTHPQRFDSVAQVLCREGQFGDASYWEVEWRGGGWIDIGATYKRIGRKGGGKPCLLGRNENSWRLRCTHAGYAAWHDNRKTTVAAPPCPRIGVFLERHKGALSFYSVSDSMVLLHTFRCPFSQPIYPAFRLDLDSTLLLCPQEVPSVGY
ncbi:E3 ubiquitin/ISG15 ligase TRIM25-like [Stigmatopora argus]